MLIESIHEDSNEPLRTAHNVGFTDAIEAVESLEHRTPITTSSDELTLTLTLTLSGELSELSPYSLSSCGSHTGKGWERVRCRPVAHTVSVCST